MILKTLRSLTFTCLFLLGCLAPGVAGQQAAPDPGVLLRQMCDYLKSIDRFSFRAEVVYDTVYRGEKKLQYGMDMETFVRRPDRVRINAEGDRDNKQFYFNGKTIVLFDRNHKVYGSEVVPADIEGALDKAHKDLGLEVALADLASPLLYDHASRGVRHSLYVGMHKVRGTPCHHLAFDRENDHVQLWIDAGEKPLLRKIAITYKKRDGSPLWVAYLSDWNVKASLEDNLFEFNPPPDVQKIKFVPVQQTTTPKKKEGGKS